MRLNIDCVRDVMLWAESLTTPTQLARYVDIDIVEESAEDIFINESDIPVPDEHQKALLAKYNNEILIYHLRYCIEAGLLIKNENISDNMIIFVQGLTPAGHDFMADVRKDKNFEAIKSVCKLIGVESVKACTAIASQNTFQNIGDILSALQKLAQ